MERGWDFHKPVVYILDGETQLRALDEVCNYHEGHLLSDMILKVRMTMIRWPISAFLRMAGKWP
jgi:predicted alpha/beta superfamily hydrolase